MPRTAPRVWDLMGFDAHGELAKQGIAQGREPWGTLQSVLMRATEALFNRIETTPDTVRIETATDASSVRPEPVEGRTK